jgi:hypothetical protein
MQGYSALSCDLELATVPTRGTDVHRYPGGVVYRIGAVGTGPSTEPYFCTLHGVYRLGCINHFLSVHQFRGLLCTSSPLAQSIALGGQAPHSRQARAPHEANANGKRRSHDVGCKHLDTHLHMSWGQGTDPSIADAQHSQSCLFTVGLSSSHLQQFQTRKGPQTIPSPTSCDLSFRTSFSFSHLGFSSGPFVTRYQPVGQSLFHTLSHQGRLSGTGHCAGWHTRKY